MSFAALMKQLPSFSDDQLRELELRIKFLRKGEQPAEKPIDHDMWLLSGVYSVLRKRGLLQSNPPIAICRSIAPECEAVATEQQHALLQGSARQLTAAEKLMLGNVAALALSVQMAARGPIGLKRMLQNLEKTVDSFDAMFPRYLECKLVAFIISGTVRRGR